MNNRICSILIFLFGFLFIVPEKLYAQSPFPNARDDSYPLLGLKEQKVVMTELKVNSLKEGTL